jgi:dCMP deaminase
MPKIEEIDKICMKSAEEWSKMSKCKRKKVACIIYKPKNNTIISVGYNGTPSGFDNNCENHVDGKTTNWWVLHAEANAIVKMVKVTSESTEGSTLYTTCSPCKECAKLIIQAGIKRLLYRDVYRDEPQLAYEAVDLLRQADIEVNGVLKY